MRWLLLLLVPLALLIAYIYLARLASQALDPELEEFRCSPPRSPSSPTPQVSSPATPALCAAVARQ